MSTPPNHKISPLRWLERGFALVLLLGLMLAATTAQRSDVFVGGEIHFLDADCYSRMSRVAQVMEHPLHSIQHHAFENFPAGTDPHTTAPLDWLIAALATLLRPFSPQALDLAGAWISPLLGLATLLVLWIWSTRERLPYRHAMLVLLAASPVIAQAFRLGRPDHQSLLLLLLAIGLATEWNLWRGAGRRTALVWGAAWGLALWTSLYEPLVLFGLLLVVRSALLRRDAFTRTWRVGWLAAAAVFTIGLLFDGWRIYAPAPEVGEYFARWSRQIGELASLPPLSPQFPGWLSWLGVAAPLLLITRFVQTRDRRLLGLLAVMLVTYALTSWQIRWGCYLALATAMATPFALPVLRWRALAWSSFVIGLWPMAANWDSLLFPDEPELIARTERREEATQLHALAVAMRAPDQRPFLAPWWLSPALAYWSGQPGVAGSSHESLPGIVESARIFLTTDHRAAIVDLRARGVRYVILDDPARTLPTSAGLLGATHIPAGTFGAEMMGPGANLEGTRLVKATEFFRLYEVER